MEKNRGAPAEERSLRGYPVTRINLAERYARMQHRDDKVVFFEVPISDLRLKSLLANLSVTRSPDSRRQRAEKALPL